MSFTIPYPLSYTLSYTIPYTAEETINKKAYWHSVLDLAGVLPTPENGA